MRRLFFVFGSPRAMRLPFSVREDTTHPNRGSVQIDVRPLEPQELSASYASVQGEHVEGFEPVSSRRLEQASGLGRG